jgi:hypothetical protein
MDGIATVARICDPSLTTTTFKGARFVSPVSPVVHISLASKSRMNADRWGVCMRPVLDSRLRGNDTGESGNDIGGQE